MATNNFFPQQLQIKYFYFAHTPMNDVKQVLASTFVKEFEVFVLAGMFIADDESLIEKVIPQPDLHSW